jgi:molybdopterin-guanine dinucleotide biosynthesis protein A
MSSAERICPVLYGLVLAGGRGRRIGRDKGSTEYHGQPQVTWALGLLGSLCKRAYVSVRPDQSEQGVYSGLPQIVDSGGSDGPAAGLRAAVQRVPGVAWLVIAADMPLLDSATLTRLVAERDSSVLATAYRHRDGTPEPLCAIWEPMVAERLAGGGSEPRGTSLRRLLVEGPAKLLASADEGAFRSANTPADDAAIRRAIAQRAHPHG